MRIRVYIITSDVGNLPIGTAYDDQTLLTLLEFARMRGDMVLLMGERNRPVSRSFRPDDAIANLLDNLI